MRGKLGRAIVTATALTMLASLLGVPGSAAASPRSGAGARAAIDFDDVCSQIGFKARDVAQTKVPVFKKVTKRRKGKKPSTVWKLTGYRAPTKKEVRRFIRWSKDGDPICSNEVTELTQAEIDAALDLAYQGCVDQAEARLDLWASALSADPTSQSIRDLYEILRYDFRADFGEDYCFPEEEEPPFDEDDPDFDDDPYQDDEPFGGGFVAGGFLARSPDGGVRAHGSQERVAAAAAAVEAQARSALKSQNPVGVLEMLSLLQSLQLLGGDDELQNELLDRVRKEHADAIKRWTFDPCTVTMEQLAEFVVLWQGEQALGVEQEGHLPAGYTEQKFKDGLDALGKRARRDNDCKRWFFELKAKGEGIMSLSATVNGHITEPKDPAAQLDGKGVGAWSGEMDCHGHHSAGGVFANVKVGGKKFANTDELAPTFMGVPSVSHANSPAPTTPEQVACTFAAWTFPMGAFGLILQPTLHGLRVPARNGTTSKQYPFGGDGLVSSITLTIKLTEDKRGNI